MNCTSCGAPLPSGARFCPACGEPASTRGDERRIATVLFADLVGFTSLGENMDPENVKNLVDGHFKRLVGVVSDFGGRVDKIVGDAIVALFGAPIAHEDDAERAVRAALEMQRVMEVELTDSSVRMRVGVNTGQVLVGALKSGGDYTAMGDAINVASRLESAAAPGEVLVGPETYHATHGVIRYEAVGPIDVKGRVQPVETWRALDALALPGSKPHSHRAPMVGRDVEFGLLKQVLATSVAKSRAYMAMVLGEAGVGKTRLAHEVANLASAEHGARVLEGRCLPYGEANVWWPVASALKSACEMGDDGSEEDVLAQCRTVVADLIEDATAVDGSGEVDRVVSGLMYLMGFEAGVDPLRASDDAISAAKTLIAALAKRTPVVMILGELHWADDEVLDFVDGLLEQVKELPVVLLALARTEIEDRWTPRLSGKNLLSVTLEALEDSAAETLLTSLVDGEPSEELRSFVLGRSGGNPFFMEEIVALLRETNVLAKTDDGGTGFDPGAERRELPATLRGLISARLDSLSAAERRAIDDAAILGRSGSKVLLKGMLGASGHGESAEAAVAALIGKELLTERGPNLEFRSDSIREVAYETLTKSERARRHALAADQLLASARVNGRESEYVEQLATHFGTAAVLDKEVGAGEVVPQDLREHALEWVERAAARAIERERSGDAERLYDRMAELLLPDERALRKRALLGRAHARTWLHRLDEAKADALEVLEMAESDADEASLASALTALGAAERLGNRLNEAAPLFERAVAIWTRVGDSAGEAEALRAWAMTDLFEGNLDPVQSKLDRALELYREVGDLRGEGLALQSLAWVAFRAGDISEAEAWINRSLSVFNKMEVEGSEAWALGLLAWLRYSQGRWKEAGEIAARLIERLRSEHGPPWAIGMIETLIAQISRADGRIRDSMNEAIDARETFESIGDQWGRLQALLPLALALVHLGKIEDSAEVMETAREIALQLPDPRLTVQADLVSAAIHLKLGEAETALRLVESAYSVGPIPIEAGGELKTIEIQARLMLGGVEEALAMIEENRGAIEELPAQPAFANVTSLCHSAAGDPVRAKEYARAALAADGWLQDRVDANIALGIAEANLGNKSEALAAFYAAAELASGAEARLQLAEARLARSLALEKLGLPDADSLKADARSRLAEMGVSGWGRLHLFEIALGIDEVERSER